MNSSVFYAVCLFLACLAAAMLGYALGGQADINKPLESLTSRERVTDIFSIEQEGTVEAQGSYVAINDRGVKHGFQMED